MFSEQTTDQNLQYLGPPERPPLHLLVLYRLLGWRLPERWRRWAAFDIASTRCKAWSTCRLAFWFLVGTLVYNLIQLTNGPNTIALGRAWRPLAVLAVGLGARLSPGFSSRARARALEWQRVYDDGTPNTDIHPRAWMSNSYLVLSLAISLAFVAGISDIGVKSRHPGWRAAAGTDEAADCIALNGFEGNRPQLDEAFVDTPDGFKELRQPAPGLGSLTAEDLAREAKVDSLSEGLKCAGFQFAVRRGWMSTVASHQRFAITLYRFGSAAGARGFARGFIKGAQGHGQAAEVESAPTLRIIMRGRDRLGYFTDVVVGSVANDMMVVLFIQPTQPPRDLVEQIALLQFERLA